MKIFRRTPAGGDHLLFVFFAGELLFDRIVGPDADFGEGRVGYHGLTDGAVLVRIERTAQVDLAQAARFCAGDVLVQWDERCLTAVHEIEEGLDQRRREWTDGVQPRMSFVSSSMMSLAKAQSSEPGS